ncbi:MAG: ATP-dependent zinc metalloprotease FtsH, partial [Planctomycetia bacterium]|nr:ATP-dependent zinc metalloprotease FtsH [Planctomycetia bacterium]
IPMSKAIPVMYKYCNNQFMFAQSDKQKDPLSDEIPVDDPVDSGDSESEKEPSDQKAERGDNPDSDESDNKQPLTPDNNTSGSETGCWTPFWLILLIVFGLIFLGNSYLQPDRHEIPIMLLVKLVEQGNSLASPQQPVLPSEKPVPEVKSQEGKEESDTKSTESAQAADNPISISPADTRYIIVEEGEGKKIKLIRYSQLDNIVISPYEVTGTVLRQIIEPTNDKKEEKPIRVEFFSGRQGLNFDNNELFNQFKDHGFENVSAKGEPGFMEKYGTTLLMVGGLVLLTWFLLRRLGTGAMAFGRNYDIQVAPEDIHVSFENVAGVDEAVEELREIVDFLRRPEKFRVLGGRIPKGILLVGPPGTGKTLIAKAVAGEAGVPFFSLSGSDFVELYAGVGAARVRDLVQQAQKNSPCIIFIDELDALGKARSANSFGAHDEREQTLNALLVEMDGFGTNSGTIVMAATNRPEILDSALLRSGRFDRQVLVDRPDIGGREEILKIHSRQVKMADDVDLHQIASITSGFVGADLEALVNEAALLAGRANKNHVTMEEFNEAVERITSGLQKKRRVMTESEKRRVSWHECGHALAATLLPHSDPVHKVSIIPRGFAALGYTLQRPDDERFLMTKAELESRIQILLAGTVAEEIVFEDVSTGAQSDLERATGIARNMVMLFGMSSMGKLAFRMESKTGYLSDTPGFAIKEHSEQTAWNIDQEVTKIMEALYRKTKELLSEHRDTLDRLALRLLEKEVMNTDELNEVISNVTPEPLAPETQKDE